MQLIGTLVHDHFTRSESTNPACIKRLDVYDEEFLKDKFLKSVYTFPSHRSAVEIKELSINKNRHILKIVMLLL